MNISVFFYSSSSDSDNDVSQVQIRRGLRDKSNPLSLPAAAFKKRFRLSKPAFEYVLSELEFEGHMSTSVPSVLQLAATLSLLGSGSFQHVIGQDYLIGMAQSTMSKTIKYVLQEVENKLCPKFIKFVPENSEECIDTFLSKYKIPGVVGCVDGTHFGLQKPTSDEHMFFNRKGFYSPNSMI
ncbi:PREDICTED: putative nuclease HARBI1, partial [Rhagoletis zephyria]|uniref:putative nuclease HARBI1 n=1 Tax=Rhagoletis zephyria TaxID=28612 RepID=UPI000811A461